ncbi:GntR family transcriptional regulator [Paractinoplanes ovalisporus]|uniref:GntR family transcriptional regulator n=1 Tax=Paractinoplanes ovalisporus TaxID=2810368 RepID=UPI0027DCDD3A|nr:UTRA domain-containing protein [Actinoplanes ovalisporus]
MRKLNLKSRTDYRRIGKAETPADVAKTLEISQDAPSLLRSRVLYANDEPTQIADSYIPWEIAEGCESLMQPNAGPGGSYGRLEDLGHGPVRFEEEITVRMPTEPEQRTLDLEPLQPVFQIWHVAYTARNLPIAVTVHVMPGHVWTLHYAWDDKHSQGE